MIDITTLPRLVIPTGLNVAAKLAGLRCELESTGSWPGLEISAALLLADVCQALGLSEADQQSVLGASGMTYVKAVVNAPLRLR
jgi:hypothetical protein